MGAYANLDVEAPSLKEPSEPAGADNVDDNLSSDTARAGAMCGSLYIFNTAMQYLTLYTAPWGVQGLVRTMAQSPDHCLRRTGTLICFLEVTQATSSMRRTGTSFVTSFSSVGQLSVVLQHT
jgi:hypothetical protein